jgi:hypothetical protein
MSSEKQGAAMSQPHQSEEATMKTVGGEIPSVSPGLVGNGPESRAEVVLSDQQVRALRSERGWAKETIRAIEQEVLASKKNADADLLDALEWMLDAFGDRNKPPKAMLAMAAVHKARAAISRATGA